MSTTTEAPFVVSHNFCAIRANTVEELEANLAEFVSRPHVSNLISQFRETVSTQGVTRDVTPAPAPSVPQAVQNVVDAGIVAETVSSTAGIEMRKDQFGNTFTRGNPDAGSCIHGPRLVMNGTNKSGAAYKAYACVNESPFREGRYDKSAVCKRTWPSRD